MTETQVNLNVHEIGIILSAIQLLELNEEKLIAHEYGSVPTLYHKLYDLFQKMDTSHTELKNDFSPSF